MGFCTSCRSFSRSILKGISFDHRANFGLYFCDKKSWKFGFNLDKDINLFFYDHDHDQKVKRKVNCLLISVVTMDWAAVYSMSQEVKGEKARRTPRRKMEQKPVGRVLLNSNNTLVLYCISGTKISLFVMESKHFNTTTVLKRL